MHQDVYYIKKLNKKILNLIIFFKVYHARKDSIRIRSRKGLTIITAEGLSFINGKWEEDVFLKFLPLILKKYKEKL